VISGRQTALFFPVTTPAALERMALQEKTEQACRKPLAKMTAIAPWNSFHARKAIVATQDYALLRTCPMELSAKTD
jgi:hypothetical protein